MLMLYSNQRGSPGVRDGQGMLRKFYSQRVVNDLTSSKGELGKLCDPIKICVTCLVRASLF